MGGGNSKQIDASKVGGSGGGILVVTVDDEYIMNKTWQEIYDAIASGIIVIAIDDNHYTEGEELQKSIYIISRASHSYSGDYNLFAFGSNDVYAHVSDPEFNPSTD